MLPALIAAPSLTLRIATRRDQPPPWLLALLAGIMLSLAFPCHPGHPLAFLYHPVWAWIGLVPLFAALRVPATMHPFQSGLLTGTTMALLSLYWVAHTYGGGLAVVGGTLLLALYLGMYVGLYALAQHFLLCRWGDRALLAAPILWTSGEYLLSLGELGFPWLLLGHSQAAMPRFIQPAALTGVYGVSFWVVSLNVFCALALAGKRRARQAIWLLIIMISLIAPVLYAATVVPSNDPAASSIRVSVIQHGFTQADLQTPGGPATMLRRLEDLSRQAAIDNPDLLVWPETAVPCHLRIRPHCRNRVQALVDELQIPLLTGASDYDRERDAPFNAAFMLLPGQSILPRYAKMHLVPFGERTPYRDRIPWLRRIDWSLITGDLGPAEFAPGTERTLFAHPQAPIVMLICFEAVFPDFTRRGVQLGGRLLVNITNDSWFGDTAGPYQHASLAAMRAVENRTAMARSASTGLSLFVDPYGRIHQQTSLGGADVRTRDLPVAERTTLYSRHGDWFPRIVLLGAMALLCLALALPAARAMRP